MSIKIKILLITLICSITSFCFLSIAPRISAANVVTIDGYDDDWDNIPKTFIGNSNNDKLASYYGSLYVENGVLYGYYSTNNKTKQMPVDHITLKVNNRTLQLNILSEDNTTYYPDGKTNINIYYKKDAILNSGVYFSNMQKDFLEFAIDLNELSTYTKIPAIQMSEFSLHNPSLGSEWVSVAGTSSFPYILSAIAFIFSVTGFFLIKNKKVREK